MKKLVVVLFALIAVSIAVYVGSEEYRARQVPPAIFPSIKNVSLRVVDSLSYQAQPSQITYRELFDKIDKNISEIDSKVIDIQTLQTAKNSEKLRPLLEYVKTSQEVLRAEEMVSRKEMEVQGAVEASRAASRELGSSYFGYEFAKRSLDQAQERFNKASAEYSDAREAFQKTLQKFSAARQNAAAFAGTEFLADPQVAAKLLSKIRGEGVDPTSAARHTMADMRTIATAWEAYATDHNTYAMPNTQRPDAELTYEQLAKAFCPTYLRVFPRADGWSTAYRFRTESNGQTYVVRSLGANGRFDQTPTGPTTDAGADIVYSNGTFVSYPAAARSW